MSFLNLIKKKKVPDELPALITEDIERENIIEFNIKKNEDISKRENSQKYKVEENLEETKKNNNLSKEVKESSSKEESFFTKLQENMNNEMGNLDKLEEWYNNKLLPEDTLSEMKTYWEKQKSSSVIQTLGKDFQDRIAKQILLLQGLEKNWQDIYFDLTEKEQEIKDEEKKLKKMLSEFIEFCKKRTENEKIS